MGLSLTVAKYISQLWSSITDWPTRNAVQDLAAKLQQLATDLNAASTDPFPSGVQMPFGTACPTGWTEVTAASGKFLKFTTSAAGDVGTTGGSATHSHGVGTLATQYEDAAITATLSGSSTVVAEHHHHTIVGLTDVATIDPPWFKGILCQKN